MKARLIAGAALCLLCATGTRAGAQEIASTFDQLTVLVKPGDTITVVDTAGSHVEGQIATVSREALTLFTKSGMRRLAEADVTTIRQRRSDSLQNGAIIGAVAGAGYGVAMLALAATMSDGGGPIPAGVILGMTAFTGIGAAAGAGLDALITRRQVILDRRGAARTVSVSPLLLGGRRGVAVSVTF